MKTIQLTILFLIAFMTLEVQAQHQGNAYYLNRGAINKLNTLSQLPAVGNASISNDDDIYLTIKGLANVKADSLVAIFSVSQVAPTVEEVERLINEKINGAVREINAKGNIDTYIDMVSFIPVYQVEVEKKTFSKNSYKEVPAGFELKKNIHIKYADPNLLSDVIAICAKYDIYDMVRVDYFSSELENIKTELMKKAGANLKRRIDNYEDLMMVNLDENKRQMNDGYKMVLPQEMYNSYQTYQSSSLDGKKSAVIDNAIVAKTHYYQPIVDKDFDFTINSTIHEPVIQVMYTLNFKIVIEEPTPEEKPEPLVEKVIEKEFILVTPQGNIKSFK